MMAYLVWLGLTVTLTGVMLVGGPEDIRRRTAGWRAGSLGRFLRGEGGLWGSCRVGLALAAGVWWCGAAGILVSDAVRAGIVLVAGCGLVIALLNAGRRAGLPTLHCVCLAGVLSAALVLLLIIGGRVLPAFAAAGW
ncbi:hypothetical protein [Serratia nevei]|uniref:hypothetical protein n=1 Tax=Serratia nevei TaxID=2703794 RepID=UPI00313D28B6